MEIVRLFSQTPSKRRNNTVLRYKYEMIPVGTLTKIRFKGEMALYTIPATVWIDI